MWVFNTTLEGGGGGYKNCNTAISGVVCTIFQMFSVTGCIFSGRVNEEL